MPLNGRCGAALRTGTVTSVDLVSDAIAIADAQLAAGSNRGPLHGFPLDIKDFISTNEAPTTG